MQRTVGIKKKVWMSIGLLGASYVLLLLMVQWTASLTNAHMNAASASLVPAAMRSQEAEAAFQRLTRRYNDAVVLQDKKALQSADQDAQAVDQALEAAAGKLPAGS